MLPRDLALKRPTWRCSLRRTSRWCACTCRRGYRRCRTCQFRDDKQPSCWSSKLFSPDDPHLFSSINSINYELLTMNSAVITWLRLDTGSQRQTNAKGDPEIHLWDKRGPNVSSSASVEDWTARDVGPSFYANYPLPRWSWTGHWATTW